MAAPPDDLLDHDYDGIKEFDNPLPKWWVYLFYGCIAFALAYVPYYHFGPGPLPRDEWAKDMTQWWADHPPPKLASHDELEAMAADPSFAAAGESVYKIRCIACHAMDGGGLVGPNLTDDFTIYGQGRDQIVAVIFHGTKNGMLAWKDQLSLTEIYQVGAYVHSLRGTTPAKAKEPQGVAIADTAAATPEPASEPAAEPTPAAVAAAAEPTPTEGAAPEAGDPAASEGAAAPEPGAEPSEQSAAAEPADNGGEPKPG